LFRALRNNNMNVIHCHISLPHCSIFITYLTILPITDNLPRYDKLIKQAGWFLRPDCAPSSECLPNVVPNSEFQTCPDPKFPNALHCEFMNTPNVEFLNVPLCSPPMSYLAGSKWGRPQRVGACSEHAVLAAGA